MGLLSWLMPVTVALALALEVRADASDRKDAPSAGPIQASSAQREPGQAIRASETTKRDTAKKERPPAAPKKTTSAVKKPTKGNEAQLGSAARRDILAKGKPALAKKGAKTIKPAKGRV